MNIYQVFVNILPKMVIHKLDNGDSELNIKKVTVLTVGVGILSVM
jgi:hypothetical protein